jgi:carbon-monoxide dehydrogenase large subunit
MDTLMDEIAKRVGITRREVREINLVTKDQFPYTPVGGFYIQEQGSYVEALQKAMEIVEFDNFPAYQERMRQEGRCVGLGISCGAEAAARGASWYGARGLPISGQEGCTIKVDPNGKVYAQLGTTTQGQGLETSLAQMVADELGVEPTDVHVTMGDTDSTPYGSGTWASRCAVIGGTATYRATQGVAEKIRRIASHMLEASVDDLDMSDGKISVKGSPGSSVALRDVAQMAYFRASEMPSDIEPALEATNHFDPPSATFSNSTHAVILEVDRRTGRIIFHRYVIVEDCGTILNPLIVDGQIYGAFAQGVGGAIFEHTMFDEQGQPLCTTFMDYLVPTSLDVPQLEIHHLETPSPHTALGVKGVGESGTVFAPGAITTGVADALGIRIDRMGLSPSVVHGLANSELAGAAV